MKRLIAISFLFVKFSLAQGQSVTELYQSKKYQELTKIEKEKVDLKPDELYMIGFAHFQTGNDEQAIACYDKAMAKGLDDGYVHFYKGLSLRYLKRYDEAMPEIEKAIQKEPRNQEFLNEKGLIFYYQDQPDKALAIFEQAKKLPNTFGEPYYWIARIYHEKQDFTKALDLYYEALANLPKTNSYYQETLETVGLLEFTVTNNYQKSARAYKEAVARQPRKYILYAKLMKAYNGAGQYEKADSIFILMKIAYSNKELPEDEMRFGNMPIAEYQWNGQRVSVYRQLADPKDMTDIYYKMHVLAKDGSKIERTLMVEKTLQMPNGPKYLLCEKGKKPGSHITYSYGWKTDKITLDDLKKAVALVLEDKIKPSASSSFGSD